MNNSSLLDDLELILLHWKLLFFFVFIGGGVALLISLNNIPIFEARSSMNFYLEAGKKTGINTTNAVISLSNVFGLISPGALGPTLASEFGMECKNIALTDLQIERRDTKWDLVVRCSNPQAAAKVANAWADQAFSLINDAYEHRLKFEALSTTFSLLKNCNTDPGQQICSGFSDPESMNQWIISLSDEIGKEKQSSQGIHPNLIYRIDSYASVPEKPVERTPQEYILAGVIIGLMLGFLWIKFQHHLSSREAK